MSNPVDALRQILQTKAVAAITALNFACKIGNEPFNVPTDGSLYGEFWYTTGKTSQLESAGGAAAFERMVGIMQFTIYAPEDTGDGPGIQMGEALKKRFNRAHWAVPGGGYLKLDPVAVKPMTGTVGAYKVVVVDCSFDYDYNDPTAVFPT